MPLLKLLVVELSSMGGAGETNPPLEGNPANGEAANGNDPVESAPDG